MEPGSSVYLPVKSTNHENKRDKRRFKQPRTRKKNKRDKKKCRRKPGIPKGDSTNRVLEKKEQKRQEEVQKEARDPKRRFNQPCA